MIAARWRSAILRSAFALRTALVAAVFLSADVFTPTPIFAAEDESSVGGESLILAPSPSLAELGDESFHSLISPTANTAIADTNLLLRHRDSWRRRLGLRTQSAMESLVGTPALADAMRRLESGDLLLKDFSHRAGNVFFNAAADFSANEIQRLAGLDSIVKRIEIGYDSPLGQHDGSGRADIFLSLWENNNTLLFGQIGGILQERDNRWEPGGNVGLGLRFQAGAIIFGGNAFFDYLNDDNPGDFQRYSVGLEALTSHVDWSINTYRRISDIETKTTDAGTFIVYTAEGWDSEIALRIPGAEWLELAARRYEWERERSGKLVGFDYRLSFLLLESFSLDATFDAPEDGDSDWGVNARFHFDLTDGFHFRRASAESLTDPWHRRYESVRRRYEQRIIEEITILPPPPPPVVFAPESDTMISGEGTATFAFDVPDASSANGGTVEISVDQSGTTSALSAQSGTTPALSANQSGPALSVNDFEPNARTCNDSGVCEWIIVTVASAGESTAGEVNCVIDGDGCRISIILSPPPALLTQDSIRVEITEAGGFPLPDAPLILAVENAVQFSAANLAAALAEDSTANVIVQALAPVAADTIVTISLVTGTAATPIADYQLLDSSNTVISCDGNNNCAITISANAMMEEIQITALADTAFENVESFSLTLVDGSDYALGRQQTFGGRIISSDGTPLIQFTADSLTPDLAEGSNANIVVRANAAVVTPLIITISLGITGDTATPITDYQLLVSSGVSTLACVNNNCAITISAGAMMEQIQITATLDGIFENVESFSLTLVDGSDYALDTRQTFGGRINNSDGTPLIQFTADSLASDLAEGGNANIVVQANAAVVTPLIITISLGITGDTATPITDYQLLDSSDAVISCPSSNCAITISANAQNEIIQVTAFAEGESENVESFSLTLVDGSDYNLDTQTTFTGMISSIDGVPIIEFTADALGSPLAEDSTADIVVRANVIVSTPLTITIALGLAADTATPITDYQLLVSSGVSTLACVNNNCAITISAGAMMEQIQITAHADTTAELTEAFSLTLVDTNDYNLGGRDVFTGMISNVGGIAAMRFSTANITTPIAENSSAVVAVNASAPVSTPTTVTIALVAGTAATPMTDYQLRDSSGTAPLTCVNNNCAITLAANTTVASFRISATDDSISELAEAFSLMLIEDSGVYALGTPDTLAGAIASDVAGGVASMEFTAAGFTATLGEGGSAVSITVQANAVRSTPTIVTISLVADPTGARRNLPDRDYQLLNSESSPTALTCDSNNRCAITISAGVTVEVIQITAIANTTVELAEAFSLMLIGGSDYNLGSQRTTFTGEIASDLPGGVNQASMQFIATGLAANLDEGAIPATITVRANAVRTTPTIVTISLVATVDATDATPMADYRLFDSDGTTPLTCVGINNCAITIAANVTVEVIRITAIVDDAFENVESFTLSLVNGSDYALVSSQDTFGGMISSIDGTPIIQFVGNALSDLLRESIAASVTVQAIAPVAADTVVTVSLGVSADTATPIADYVLLVSSGLATISCVSNNCAITISAGMTDEIIQVMAIADTDTEAVDEPFSLSLIDDGGPGGGNYDLVSSQDTFTGTITDAGGVHFSSDSVTALAAANLTEGDTIMLTVETDTAFTADTVVTISVGVTVGVNADTATPDGLNADYELRDSSGTNPLTCDGDNNCEITIPMNVTMASFQLSIIANTLVELPESFSLVLIEGDDYELVSPDTLRGVIQSDLGVGVNQASMEFSAANLPTSMTLSEGGNADITVRANAARTTPTIVTVSLVADNAAIFDTDYELFNVGNSTLPCNTSTINSVTVTFCTVIIPANGQNGIIEIRASIDTTTELAEAFSLSLVDGSDYALGAQRTFTDEIASDLAGGVNEASMRFTAAGLAENLDEGNTASTTNVIVEANAVRTTPTIVTISLVAAVDATDATPITDYQLLDSSGNALTCDATITNLCAITIAANVTVERIQITAHSDDIFEIAESFSLVLIDGSDYALVSTQDIFTGTIDNGDGIPIVQFTADAPSAALAENTDAVVIVQTTAPAAPVFADTVVTISLVADTTATGGTDGRDYLLFESDGTTPLDCNPAGDNCFITIPMNEMMASFVINALADTTPELDEAFSLMLIEGDAYDLNTQNSFGGDITGDIDGTEASVQFTAPSLSPNLAEGDAVNVVVRANAVRNTPTIVTISLVAAVDTATDATPITDYQLLNPSNANPLDCVGINNCAITISANMMQEEILITALAEGTFENVESFSLMLVDDGNAYDLDTQDTFTGNINNRDGTPLIEFAADSLGGAGVAEGSPVNVIVVANGPVPRETVVTISLAAAADATTDAMPDDPATPDTVDGDYQLLHTDGTTVTCTGTAANNRCTITLAIDAMTVTFQVMAITDTDIDEQAEEFLLTLIDGAAYNLDTQTTFTGMINNVGGIPNVQFSTANIATPIIEGFTSATTSPNLAVSTSAPVESPVTITIALVPPVNDAFATPDDPARPGFDGDYALLNSVGVALTCVGNNCLITIAMGEMMAPFQITAIDDASGAGTELAEPFRLTLIDDGVAYNLATPDSLTGEIASNVPDGEARMQFSPAALVSNLDEGTTFANIVVRADFPRSTPTIVTISVGVTGNTATPDDPATADFDGDYRLLDSDGTPLACDSNNRCAITLDAAARTETFQIIARLDGDFENVQSFSLVLIDGGDYELGSPTTFTGNINNRDGTPIIQFSAASLTDDLTEGSATVVIVEATAPVVSETIVIISLVAAADATTDARPDDPDTISVDGDYQLLNSAGTPITCDSNNLCRITFDAGDSEVRIQVRAVSDTQIAEEAELFSLMLIDDPAYILGSPFTFTGTIANVAIPIVQFSTANLGAAIAEGTSVDFEVTSIAAVGTPTFITISVGVSTDTATPDDPATPDDFDGDYQLLDSDDAVIPCENNLCRITLDAGETTENLKLTVREDSTGEFAELFSLTLIDEGDTTYNLGSTTVARGTITSHPRMVITTNGATATDDRFEITVTFEPPLPASLVGGLESVNLQMRGYDDFTDFTSIAPTNFRFDGPISGSDPSLGRRSTYTFTGANVRNPMVAAITLNAGISGDTIELRITAAGAPIQTLYSSPGAIQLRNPDNSHYSLTVTFP